MLTRFHRRALTVSATTLVVAGLVTVSAPAFADDTPPLISLSADSSGLQLSVNVPPLDVPSVQVPSVDVPPITVPPVTVPPVTTPVVTTPEVTTPTVTTPPVSTPTVTTPTVTTPEVSTPTVTTPTVGTPATSTPATGTASTGGATSTTSAASIPADWATSATPAASAAPAARRTAAVTPLDSMVAFAAAPLKAVAPSPVGSSPLGIVAGQAPARTVTSNDLGIAMLGGLGVLLILVIAVRLAMLRGRTAI